MRLRIEVKLLSAERGKERSKPGSRVAGRFERLVGKEERSSWLGREFVRRWYGKADRSILFGLIFDFCPNRTLPSLNIASYEVDD